MSTVSGTFSTGFGAEFSGSGFTAERPRPVTPRLRLTKRGRGVLMTVAATPLVIGAFLFALNGTPATASLEGSSAGFTYLTVESGQSLWQLAEELAPAADPRDTIAEIMTLNRLESADVFAGQEIALPAHLVD